MTLAEIFQQIADHWLEIIAIVALIAVSGFFSVNNPASKLASHDIVIS